MATWKLEQDDILDWAKSKQGQLTGYGLGKWGWILTSLFKVSVCGLCNAVAGMTEGNQVNQIIGAFIVAIEKTKRYLMMNYQSLTESILTLFFGQAALLTGVAISFKGFASLSIPVWPVPVTLVPIDIVGSILSYPVLITAFAAAIFTKSPFRIVDPGWFNIKLTAAIKTIANNASLWPVSSSFILTSWGTMFTPAMLHSTREYIKGLFTVDIFTDSFDCLFQNKTPLSVGSLSRRYPISRQRGLIQ